MRHRNRLNRLSLRPSHRNAMIKNMLTSLFRHESIKTTKAKAKVVQKAAEKMITRAKVDSVHNRREIFKDIKDKAILNKLFTEIGPLFVDRKGGYTRVLKLGFRHGDAAEMAILELVERTADSDKSEKKADTKKSTAKKPAAKKPAAKKAPAKKAADKAPAEKPAEVDASEPVEVVEKAVKAETTETADKAESKSE